MRLCPCLTAVTALFLFDDDMDFDFSEQKEENGTSRGSKHSRFRTELHFLRTAVVYRTKQRILRELQALPEKVQKILDQSVRIERLAQLLYNRDQVFFIGRGIDSAVSYEGSLKLKEISYINSFAIAAGELKHGTIALMEPETTVIALATQDSLYDKMYSNIEEIMARHAHILAIVKEGHDSIRKTSRDVIEIPNCADEVSSILSVIPLQLFAYYVARERGEDIDKPRNLAKSVTVE